MNEIMNIQGIECYEKEGTAFLKLETVARGLGFTHVGKRKEHASGGQTPGTGPGAGMHHWGPIRMY